MKYPKFYTLKWTFHDSSGSDVQLEAHHRLRNDFIVNGKRVTPRKFAPMSRAQVQAALKRIPESRR